MRAWRPRAHTQFSFCLRKSLGSQHCCANIVGSCCVRVGSGVQTGAYSLVPFKTLLLFPYSHRYSQFVARSVNFYCTHVHYIHFTACHPLIPRLDNRFFKGKVLKILQTNSSETTFEGTISNFKTAQ